MTSVLVDTSVWVEHFRKRNAALVELLTQDRVITHPLIMGEIACGTPPQREKTLSYFETLSQVRQITLPELLAFINREKLYGLGCGLVDLILLTSTMISPGTLLWSRDRRLNKLAEHFDVVYHPVLH